MRITYGKTIRPEKLQASLLADLRAHQRSVRRRAYLYAKRATVQVRRCSICGSSIETKPFLRVYGHEYVRCQRCSHVLLRQRLPQHSLNTFYKENEEYAKTYTSADQLHYRLRHIAKPKVEYAMQFAPPGKHRLWLDVGCGIGDVLASVNAYPGWKALGVEISKSSVEKGREALGVDIRRQRFEEFLGQNPALRFDVISLFGYLEVVTDPLRQLQLAKSRLRRGGIIVVGEANADSFSTIVQQSSPHLSTRHLLPPTVIQQFTIPSLTTALKRAGFTPIAKWIFGLDFYEFIKHLSLLVDGFDKTPAHDFLTKHWNRLQRIIDRKGLGDNVILIGKLRSASPSGKRPARTST